MYAIYTQALLISIGCLMLFIPQAFGQNVSGDTSTDALDELIEWAQEWHDVDAMDVTWHRTRNTHDGAPDGPIIESILYTERTVYRWPDSWKRVVQRDDIPGNENEYLHRFDESNVMEGIQPDGSHARRMLDLLKAKAISRPPDEAIYVDFEKVVIEDRRTGMMILPNKQQVKTQPVVTPRRLPSLTHILRYGGIGVILLAAGVWWFRRRGGT